jgi:putative redox protein
MQKHSITAKWLKDSAFEGVVSGHKIIVDNESQPGGGAGASPKKLMLLALAGCTGMDITSLLTKMRVDFKDVRITVEGDLTEEHPKHYEKMHVIYEIFGKDLPMDKLQKAVALSKEKYCGVMAVYKKAITVTSEIRVTEPAE